MMNIILNKGYVKIIFLNGLLVALIKYFGVGLSTSPVNIITIIFLPLFFYQFSKSKSSSGKTVILFFLIYIVFKLLILGHFNITDTFNVFHDALAYTSFCYFFNLDQRNKLKQLLIFRKFSYLFVFIFFVQYFFRDLLPSAFTEIPNLFVEAGVEKYTRVIDDKSLYRPNGLIGNPITFGFVLNLFLVLEYFFIGVYKKTKTKSRIVITILLTMIFLLFSRANIVLAIIISLISFLKKSDVVKASLISLVFLIFIIPINDYLYSTSTEYKFTIDRLTSEDSRAAQSNNEHLLDYIKAYGMFIENPLLGSSAKKIIEDDIITDGGVPILILRNGLLGFLIILILYFSLLKIYSQQLSNSKMFFPLFIFVLLLFPYSFLNSAILNKGVYLIIFSFLGITANLNPNILKQ
jgi:hypothetical protein